MDVLAEPRVRVRRQPPGSRSPSRPPATGSRTPSPSAASAGRSASRPPPPAPPLRTRSSPAAVTAPRLRSAGRSSSSGCFSSDTPTVSKSLLTRSATFICGSSTGVPSIAIPKNRSSSSSGPSAWISHSASRRRAAEAPQRPRQRQPRQLVPGRPRPPRQLADARVALALPRRLHPPRPPPPGGPRTIRSPSRSAPPSSSVQSHPERFTSTPAPPPRAAARPPPACAVRRSPSAAS